MIFIDICTHINMHIYIIKYEIFHRREKENRGKVAFKKNMEETEKKRQRKIL